MRSHPTLTPNQTHLSCCTMSLIYSWIYPINQHRPFKTLPSPPRRCETLATHRRRMESRGYDYGSGAGTGGKIRRCPPVRAVAASPYARAATVPTHAPETAAAAVAQGGGWLSRIIAAGASRFVPSWFRTYPPQCTLPAPAPPELLQEAPSLDQLAVVVPPSLLPPPLGLSLHIYIYIFIFIYLMFLSVCVVHL